MNCYDHPDRFAVAVCQVCAKGMCEACAKRYSISICTLCNVAVCKKEIVRASIILLVYAILFYMGYYYWLVDSYPNDRLFMGYALMSVWAGWNFINAVSPLKLEITTIYGWAIFGMLKFFLAILVGCFVAPFYIGWSLFKLVRKSLQLKQITTYMKQEV